jgi:hypothetical protein
MVIVMECSGVGIVDRCPSVWVRLRAVCASARLDRDLAAGVSPESSVLLAVRARRIVSPRSCTALAHSVRSLVGEVQEPKPPALVRGQLCRSNVEAVSGALRSVADRLIQPGPIHVQGVAELRTVLGDGTGPLYWSRATGPGHDGHGAVSFLEGQLDGVLRHL